MKIARKKRTNRRRLGMQALEFRRVLAASFGWDGPGQGSAELTYYIANSPDSLTQSETNAAIETALDAWAEVADITFTQVDTPRLRDSIDISFVGIDGVAGTLAQAYFPDDVNPARIAGDIQFDISESWEVGNALGSRAFDLVWVAAHEIGHSLGLDHLGTANSVLAPFVSPQQEFVGLSSSDVAAALEIYAATDATTDGATEDESSDTLPDDSDSTDQVDDVDTDTSDDLPDSDADPFPRRRWRRGGHWHRWGGRLDAESISHNYVHPTDANGDGDTSALDALTIINQLSQTDADGEEGESTHLCDVNGDGSTTAIDALTVINALGSLDAETVTVQDDAIDSVDDATETMNDEVDVVDVDETADEDESTQEDDSSTSDDETTDEETDEGSGEDDSEDTTTVDDGGLVDDTNEAQHDHSHHAARHLLAINADDLLSEFDTSGDGLLGEDELSVKLWSLLNDAGADVDADLMLSADEIATVITSARQERFDALDEDADGSVIEDEVGERLWAKLSAADTSEDSAISFDEFNDWLDGGEANLAGRGHRHGHGHGHGHRGHHGRGQQFATDSVFASFGRTFGRR